MVDLVVDVLRHSPYLRVAKHTGRVNSMPVDVLFEATSTWGDRKNSGSLFGFMDEPLSFDMTIKTPKLSRGLRLTLTCKMDPSKKAYEVERATTDLSGDTPISLTFYNPSPGAPSGLLTPAPILFLAPARTGLSLATIVSFMFYVDILPKAKTYRLTYEFFEGSVDPAVLIKGSE
jgi:hypothetical protein